jgi:RimJ/RimL family protein N-acetyltransferase
VRLKPPEPPLADEAIQLVPLEARHEADMAAVAEDPDVRRFTYVPTQPPTGFAARWVERYVEGWRDGTRAGFAIESPTGEFLGCGLFVSIDRDAGQGEIGYLVAPLARGRGIGTRALRLLTGWGFDELGLERIELRIDVTNTGSARMAERAGYTREGVLRSLAFKEGMRSDVGVWSRLAGDP